MENHIILSVQDLDVKFTLRGQTLHAIRGVSLDVYEGESLAIVGESGSGNPCSSKPFWVCWMATALSTAVPSCIMVKT